MALVPTSRVCGSVVTGRNGEKLGSIVELMVENGVGAIGYAVLAFGGTLGVGEKLFAVPFDKLQLVETGFSLAIDPQTLESAPGFDKDAWPVEPDPLFS